ncbi:hypothetical protein ONE63_004269 [Megalurothrips usitatus]|uniref:Exonuclease domain-containing protein n=1 Tax=Megalurothrips usitatus TaxID=439358 RepID=A0AAV7X5M8_9NEOP|nr:hypothetical protein ONE63_004269 [Megalurothrips usitatus]
MACGRFNALLRPKIGQWRSLQRAAHYKRTVMPVNTYHRFRRKEQHKLQPQKFKYFLVLDFEATCDNDYFPDMEIIEFPCLKVDSKTFKVVDTFHSYVRPVKHPLLSPFCVELTGIVQDMVDDKPPFPEVLEQFSKWLDDSDISLTEPEPNAAFITCGDWDLQKMLPNQCLLSGLAIPPRMKSWINIKKSFLRATGLYPHGIKDMLSQLNLKHEGRLHSGIDDCKNIVRILHGVAERGYVFEITRTLSLPHKSVSQ